MSTSFLRLNAGRRMTWWSAASALLLLGQTVLPWTSTPAAAATTTTVSIVELGPLSGGSSSVAVSLNGAGQVVGYAAAGSDPSHAVLWQPNGTATDLGG